MFRSLDRAYTRAAAWFLALSIDARIVVAGFLVIVLAVAGFYAILWRAQAHENAVEIALLKQKLLTEKTEREAMDNSFQSQINGIDRTLYADPTKAETPDAARKPSQIENWSLNRDKLIEDHFKRIDKALFEAGLTGRR